MYNNGRTDPAICESKLSQFREHAADNLLHQTEAIEWHGVDRVRAVFCSWCGEASTRLAILISNNIWS